MNTITIIPESPIAEAFLLALLCRKHKQEEIAALHLHSWNRRETDLQAAGPPVCIGIDLARGEEERAA